MDGVSTPPGPDRRPELRASDADRQRVADRLRRAHDEGRLDLTEFDERVAAAYAARTYADLEVLTADLPPEPAVARPAAPPARRAEVSPAAVRAWATASIANIVIWGIVSVAATGPIYPWWIWVAGPWGLVLLARWIGAQHR